MQLDKDDLALITLSSSASLDRSPKKNWVENSGELPSYVRKIARSVEKSGKSLSSAIAIAISRIKVWAAGGGNVDADTKAKAAKALAEWNALKAKNKAKKLVKASRDDGSEYLMVLSASFNTELVRTAFRDVQDALRKSYYEKYKSYDQRDDVPVAEYPYAYLRELWTDHILVELEMKGGLRFANIPFTVMGDQVTFGKPVEVEIKYVEVEEDLNDAERGLLGDLLNLSAPDALGRIQAAGQKLKA